MAVSYSDAFKRQLKRLSRRYRHIRADVQPVIDQLEAGQTPGDQVRGLGHTLYKVRARNTSAKRGKSGGYRIIVLPENRYRCVAGDDLLKIRTVGCRSR